MIDDKSSIGMMILLIVGVGMAVLSLIFVGVLGGQTFQLAEPKITGVGYHYVLDEYYNFTSAASKPSYNTTCAYGIWNLSIGAWNGSYRGADDGIYGLEQFTVDYWVGSINTSNVSVQKVNISYHCGNTTIENSIKDSVTSGFNALNQTGTFIPVIVLAVIIVLVLALVLGFTGMRRGGGMGGAL